MSKILNISEAASMAVHSMALIAKMNIQINVSKIAEMTNFNKNHLAKVMQRLSKSGYIKSERGPKGGFVLGKPENEITLLEIYELMEGVIELNHCGIHKGICPFNKCVFGGMTEKLSIEFKQYLKNTTIKDVIN